MRVHPGQLLRTAVPAEAANRSPPLHANGSTPQIAQIGRLFHPLCTRQSRVVRGIKMLCLCRDSSVCYHDGQRKPSKRVGFSYGSMLQYLIGSWHVN